MWCICAYFILLQRTDFIKCKSLELELGGGGEQYLEDDDTWELQEWEQWMNPQKAVFGSSVLCHTHSLICVHRLDRGAHVIYVYNGDLDSQEKFNNVYYTLVRKQELHKTSTLVHSGYCNKIP